MFKTWSFTILSTYRQCPLRAKLRYIDNIPDPGNKYSARGTDIHNELEAIVKERQPVPEKFEYFAPHLNAVMDQDPVVEKKFRFDVNWKPTTDYDSTWLVVKQDLMVVQPGEFLLTVDYKSGQKDPAKHVQQMIVYSIAGWILYPDLPEYIAEMWYIDKKDIMSKTFTPDLLEAARARLDAEVDKMFNDTLFRPRPSQPNCQYCPYGPRGTGHCPVGL